METKQKTNLEKTLDKLEGLMEKLSGHKFISSVLGMGVLLILAETLLPESSSRIITSLVGLTTAIIDRTATEIGNIRTSVIDLGNTIRDYANRNRPKWIFFFFLYITTTIVSLFIGYNFEVNWLLGMGTVLLMTPIIFIGYVQKKIGRILKNEKGHPWIKSGDAKITLAVLIGLFALEFMLLHTVLFLVVTALFLSIAFISAGLLRKSLEPLESLKKLTFVFVGVTFLYVFVLLVAPYSTTANSIIGYISSYNYLKIVERNDQAEIITNIAKENEKSPWRLTSIDTEMRYGAYNGIDVEKEYKVRTVIPANSAVQIIKDYTFTDKFGKVWVHVKYGNKDGWAQNRWLGKNLTNDEVVQFQNK